MPQEEKNKIVTLVAQAIQSGDMEKAIILAKKMPLSPEVAEAVTSAYSAEYLKNSEFDFSEAEKKTGSLFDKAVAISLLINTAKKSSQSKTDVEEYTDLEVELLSQLTIAEKSKDPQQIIGLEKLLVSLEIEKYQESFPERLALLKSAYIELDVIEKGFKFVEKCEKYAEIRKLYHPKNIKNGIPIDHAHKAIKAYSTHLRKDIGGYTNAQEKNISQQRQKNVCRVKELYLELQQKALGLVPE